MIRSVLFAQGVRSSSEEGGARRGCISARRGCMPRLSFFRCSELILAGIGEEYYSDK